MEIPVGSHSSCFVTLCLSMGIPNGSKLSFQPGEMMRSHQISTVSDKANYGKKDASNCCGKSQHPFPPSSTGNSCYKPNTHIMWHSFKICKHKKFPCTLSVFQASNSKAWKNPQQSSPISAPAWVPAEEGRVAVADPRCSHSANQILRPLAHCNILEFEPLIFHGILCNMLLLKLFVWVCLGLFRTGFGLVQFF